MKLSTFIRSCAVAAAFALCLSSSFSQTIAGPPGFVDYQGRLLNSQGGPISGPGGPGTQGTPTNYQIQFRIWDKQAGEENPALIWAEKQVVTVDGDGLFSVRLGEGEQLIASDPGYAVPARTNLLDAFDGSSRFLGVTVLQPPATPGEISPRLAFLSSPFAAVAGKVKDGAIGTNQIAPASINDSQIVNISGDKILVDSITANALAQDSVESSEIAAGAVGTSELATGAVTTAKLGSGAVTAAKLEGTIAPWTKSGANTYWAGGNVGIGTNQITDTLTVGSSGNAFISINTPDTATAGLQWNRNNDEDFAGIYLNSSNELLINAAGNTSRMRLNSAGVTVYGTFTNSSDRNLKTDVRTICVDAVLSKLMELPIKTWRYQEEEQRRHIGPMAQDFHSSFNELLDLRSDERTIAPLDEAGVAFAAIQALNRTVTGKCEKITELETRIAALEAQNRKLGDRLKAAEKLEIRLARLESALSSRAGVAVKTVSGETPQ